MGSSGGYKNEGRKGLGRDRAMQRGSDGERKIPMTLVKKRRARREREREKPSETRADAGEGCGSPLSGPPAAWPAATLHKKL